jgi:hypothetical protein
MYVPVRASVVRVLYEAREDAGYGEDDGDATWCVIIVMSRCILGAGGAHGDGSRVLSCRACAGGRAGIGSPSIHPSRATRPCMVGRWLS